VSPLAADRRARSTQVEAKPSTSRPSANHGARIVGLVTHPLSQILDYGPTRDALVLRLGIGDSERLLSLVRVGRPVAPAARSFRIVVPCR
jgi:hypothetical protein